MKSAVNKSVEIEKETWSISPNPISNGMIHIQMNLKDNKTLVFRLLDYTGKVLLIKKAEGIKGSHDINLSEERLLNTGTYYLQAIGIEGEEVKKILIK